MSAKPAEIEDDRDAIEWELIELVEEHGSERQPLRALLHDFHALLADADKAVSRGFLRAGLSRKGRGCLATPGRIGDDPEIEALSAPQQGRRNAA